MSPSARVWALRGGEYIVAHKGEVWGNFKMRYVYPQSPLPPAEGFIDASAFGVTELADVIRREVEKRGQVSVVNVNGHRYLASGLERGVVKMWGVVGNASANVMSGGEVYVYGDVQDDFGDAMGVEKRLEPPPPVDTVAYELEGVRETPRHLGDAVKYAQESALLPEEFVKPYLALKEEEWLSYLKSEGDWEKTWNKITRWEYNAYLVNV